MYRADLHVHSCLSPCAELTMVPSVVCESEVEILSITDHNSARNVAAFVSLCSNKIIVPGIEIHSQEDVHILGYFANIEGALAVSETVEQMLPKFEYDPEKYGYELVLNEQEEFTESLDYYLGFPVNMTIEDILELIKKYNGLPVFAHVDRRFGVIQQLGMVPHNVKHVEVKKKELAFELRSKGFIVLTSSDAHTPDEVGSRKIYFEEQPKSAGDVIKLIQEGRFKTIWDL